MTTEQWRNDISSRIRRAKNSLRNPLATSPYAQGKAYDGFNGFISSNAEISFDTGSSNVSHQQIVLQKQLPDTFRNAPLLLASVTARFDKTPVFSGSMEACSVAVIITDEQAMPSELFTYIAARAWLEFAAEGAVEMNMAPHTPPGRNFITLRVDNPPASLTNLAMSFNLIYARAGI